MVLLVCPGVHQMQNEGSNGIHTCEQDLEKQGKSQEGLSVVGSGDEANQTLSTIAISNGETPEPNHTDNNDSKDELTSVMSPKKGYLSRSPSSHEQCSSDGDVINCVHISHQPTFDHPYLKDHEIQMRPNYHPKGLFDDNKVSAKASKERTNPISQLWHMNGKCPKDTIPISASLKESSSSSSLLTL